MSISLETILAWRPAALMEAADRLLRDRRTLYSLQDEVGNGGLPTGWVGEAAEAASGNHTLLLDELNDRVAGLSAAATALDGGARAFRRAKRLVEDALDYARAQGFVVDRAALTVTDASADYDDEHEKADRERLAREIVDQLEQALRAAEHADRELDEALRRVLAGVEGGEGSLREAGLLGRKAGTRDLLVPPRGGSAADHAAWWNSLTPSEQRDVIAQHPDWVGNTDGIPAWARHEANVNLIPTHREDLEQQLEDLGPPPADPHLYAVWAGQRDLIQRKLEGIDEIEDLLADKADQDHPRRLLTLDITGEKRLMAAVAVGDVDTADHVSVFTPGLDSDVYDSLTTNDARMYDLVKRAEDFGEATGSDDTYAGVFWLGYEAPQPGESLDPSRSVANDDLAKAGAPKLAGFLNGIDASRADDPHLTAIGHSYGSTVTGLALQNSTGVDDAMLMGSPGPGTDDAADLDVPDGHIHYLEADWDGVGDLGSFGSDPSGMDGIDNLSTDEGRSELLGEDLTRVTGHTSYFEDGSTSQYNAAAVMSGNHDEVIQATDKSRWEQLEDKVEEGKDWVGDRYDEGKDWAGDRYDDGKDWVGDRYDEGKEWAGDRVDDGRDWAGDRVDDGEEVLEDVGGAIEEGWKKWGPG